MKVNRNCSRVPFACTTVVSQPDLNGRWREREAKAKLGARKSNGLQKWRKKKQGSTKSKQKKMQSANFLPMPPPVLSFIIICIRPFNDLMRQSGESKKAEAVNRMELLVDYLKQSTAPCTSRPILPTLQCYFVILHLGSAINS